MSDGMNDIQYGAYRTAMKLRAVQKACCRKLQSWKDTVMVICLLNNYSFGTLPSFLLITRSCTIGIVYCQIKSICIQFPALLQAMDYSTYVQFTWWTNIASVKPGRSMA